MSRPIRRVRGLAFFPLILLVGSLARAEAQLPKVRITLMPDVPYENVFGHYVLYSPFGAHAGFVRKPGSRRRGAETPLFYRSSTALTCRSLAA